MPFNIPNTTTTNVDQIFSGHDVFASGWFTIANAAALVTLIHGISGQASEDQPAFLPPGQYSIQGGSRPDPVSGIKIRSAVAGKPAQIFGTIYYPGEASILGGQEFSGIVSPSGGITPGVSSLQFALNNVLIGTESQIDFLGHGWTIADDPTNQRIKVTKDRPYARAAMIGSVVVPSSAFVNAFFDTFATNDSSIFSLFSASTIAVSLGGYFSIFYRPLWSADIADAITYLTATGVYGNTIVQRGATAFLHGPTLATGFLNSGPDNYIFSVQQLSGSDKNMTCEVLFVMESAL